uniref:Uncharacterized protein n=1 Tax=Schistocephalus solidus TaxID=70667 RepID=A0A0X3Q4S4_SCHSO
MFFVIHLTGSLPSIRHRFPLRGFEAGLNSKTESTWFIKTLWWVSTLGIRSPSLEWRTGRVLEIRCTHGKMQPATSSGPHDSEKKSQLYQVKVRCGVHLF